MYLSPARRIKWSVSTVATARSCCITELAHLLFSVVDMLLSVTSYGSISWLRATIPYLADRMKIASGLSERAYARLILNSGLIYRSSARALSVLFLLTQESSTILFSPFPFILHHPLSRDFLPVIDPPVNRNTAAREHGILAAATLQYY